MDTMVQVFTAEQQKSIAVAETQAQEQQNKRIQFEADSKAKALFTLKEAEAKGIKAVAEAKAFEIEKAKENEEIYVQLKALENQKAQLEKWDGKFPVSFMGGSSPNLLFQMPGVHVDGKDNK
jgi:HPt (histidine-containing phosphotransfer) domain-containing protein